MVLITKLLAGYWVSTDTTEARQAILLDWLEDLDEFDLVHVEDACREWRRSSTRRPMIAEIRRLCREAREQRQRKPAPAFDREAYAREAGFATWAEREAAIDRQQDRYRKGEEWRNSEQGREWAAKRPHFGGKND